MLKENYKKNKKSKFTLNDEYITRNLRHRFEKHGFEENAFKILRIFYII